MSALRTITGAFRSSPNLSILVEAGELPLEIRRAQLTLNYITNVMQDKHHPTAKCISQDTKPGSNQIPLQLYINQIIQQFNITLPDTSALIYPKTPPWNLTHHLFNTTLSKLPKESTNPEEYKQLFNEIRQEHKQQKIIYTDASVNDGNNVGAAVVTEGNTTKYKLPNYTSIFSAELFAIYSALTHITEHHPRTPHIICTDSLSSLKNLQQIYPIHPTTHNIRNKLQYLSSLNNTITFIWIPSHIGIPGNETADKHAKEAATLNDDQMTKIPVYKEDLKTQIKQRARDVWNGKWQQTANNKLRQIKEDTKPWKLIGNKKEQVCITRLRIGHTKLTHSHLFTKTNPTQCETCNTTLTVKHIIENCTKYDLERNRHQIPPNITEALTNNNHIKNTIKFLKDTHLYQKL